MMIENLKIFEVSKFCPGDYSSWIKHSEIKNIQLVDTIDKADLVIFKGGSDVSPQLYNQVPHVTTHFDVARDVYEERLFHVVRSMGKKMLGVCRGAQFLSVMNGASLWQHIYGHGNSHKCSVDNDRKSSKDILITSSHHQCLNLNSVNNSNDNFQLLGVAEGEVSQDLSSEKEVIPEFYQFGTDSLCIQSHPEYVCDGKTIVKGYEEYIEYCRKILVNFLNNN